MASSTKATDWASARGIPHILEKSGDISFECPQCKKGKLIVHASEGWFWCFGGMCHVSGKSFAELNNVLKKEEVHHGT